MPPTRVRPHSSAGAPSRTKERQRTEQREPSEETDDGQPQRAPACNSTDPDAVADSELAPHNLEVVERAVDPQTPLPGSTPAADICVGKRLRRQRSELCQQPVDVHFAVKQCDLRSRRTGRVDFFCLSSRCHRRINSRR